MIEMENTLEMLENIEEMLVIEMTCNHFDCLMVYKPVNWENIGVKWENIEVMLENRLVRWENTLEMHCFHHDHWENRWAMLGCTWEMLDLFELKKIEIEKTNR